MRQVLLWALGLFACLWVVGKVLPFFQGEPEPNMSHVRFYCQEAVTKRLKAPSTANFSGQYETTISMVAPRSKYHVAGYVDSQNSFGAQVRTNYDCLINVYSAGRSWSYSVETVAF